MTSFVVGEVELSLPSPPRAKSEMLSVGTSHDFTVATAKGLCRAGILSLISMAGPRCDDSTDDCIVKTELELDHSWLAERRLCFGNSFG